MNYVRNGSYHSFICLDFETTGFSAQNDRITEIGAVKVLNGQLVSKFTTLINPGKRIPQNVVKLTGITNEMVASAPAFSSVLPYFTDYVQALPIVAHNAKFDGRFLEAELNRAGLTLQNPVDDTLLLAKQKLKGLTSYKLSFLTEYFNIPLNSAHRAWCDAEATARLYLALQKL